VSCKAIPNQHGFRMQDQGVGTVCISCRSAPYWTDSVEVPGPATFAVKRVWGGQALLPQGYDRFSEDPGRFVATLVYR
jgi:hypothetical protein